MLPHSGRWDRRITLTGTRGTTNPAETGHASKNRPAPKGQNMLAQGRARRRSRRAPPWVNGQPRTSIALKGRDKCARIARKHASRTSECQRHVEHDQFILPVEARESRPSIYIRFAAIRDHIPLSVLSCPFGAMDLGGALLPRAARRGSAATLCPGLYCHCPFGALGRSHRLGRPAKWPQQTSPGQSVAAQPHRPEFGVPLCRERLLYLFQVVVAVVSAVQVVRIGTPPIRRAARAAGFLIHRLTARSPYRRATGVWIAVASSRSPSCGCSGRPDRTGWTE